MVCYVKNECNNAKISKCGKTAECVITGTELYGFS